MSFRRAASQRGEGGPLQDLMESDGRPFVGSASRAARWAMDKVATKFLAQSLGLRTGLSLEYTRRSVFGAVPPVVVTTPPVLFEDGVYDDPYASDASAARAGSFASSHAWAAV